MADFQVSNPSGNYAPVSFLFNAASLAADVLAAPDRFRVDAVTVDATTSESHDADVDVTESPVESGSNISDHARAQLRTVTVEGVISNLTTGLDGSLADAIVTGATSVGLTFGTTVPSGIVSRAIALAKTGALFMRVKATFDQFQALIDAGEPIVIHTPYRDYPSMVIKSLKVVREGAIDGFTFTLTAREIRIVEARTVATVPLPAAAQPPATVGQQSGAAADHVTTPTVSALKSVTNAFGFTSAKFRTK